MEELLKLFTGGGAPQGSQPQGPNWSWGQPPSGQPGFSWGQQPPAAPPAGPPPQNYLNQPMQQQASAFDNMKSAAQGHGGGSSPFGSILKLLGL